MDIDWGYRDTQRDRHTKRDTERERAAVVTPKIGATAKNRQDTPAWREDDGPAMRLGRGSGVSEKRGNGEREGDTTPISLSSLSR
jgi:hypothetical protein